MALTAAAGGVAWALCLPFGTTPSAFAAASSVYAVQLNVRSSLVDGLKRSALMGVSLSLAVVILRGVGLTIWAVMIVVFVSMAAGRMLRLGLSGTLQIPATAIFVLALGTAVTDWQLFTRGLATLIGAVVGAVASVAAHAGDPQVQARQSIVAIVRSIADLLDDIGAGLDRGLTARDAQEWLFRARQLDDQAAERRQDIDEAVAFMRWDPLGRRQDADELNRLFTQAKHSVFQVRDIARTLLDASLDATAKVVTPTLGPLLRSTAFAFRLQAAKVGGEQPNLDDALDTVRTWHRESLGRVRQADDTGNWLMSGSVLNDVERMVQQLEGSPPTVNMKPDRPKRYRLLRRTSSGR